MKYFDYLLEEEKKEIFFKEPEEFTKTEEKEILAHALGATLYMPSIRERIGSDILEKKIKGLVSTIICLEDAIGDKDVGYGIENTIRQIHQIHGAVSAGRMAFNEIPLIFIRIRNLSQIQILADALKERLSLLTGFVIPKFSIEDGEAYFKAVEEVNRQWKTSLYLMPVLETKNIMYLESRVANLIDLKKLFDQYKDLILNVRVGATDFSSIFGFRRNINHTLYDLAVLKDCLGNIVNTFGRYDDHYVLSGPVWEYFSVDMKNKDYYLEKSIQGLIRECILDKENGFTGKTVIHPSQIIPVQALQVVTKEEYMDACQILSNEKENNGVIKSSYKNKMNEVKPHLNWARKIIIKSQIYGVYNENRCYKDILERK